MKSFLLTDNRDTFLLLRLTGIDGIYLREDDNVKEEFMKLVNNKNYGIIYITEKIYEVIKEEVIKIKTKKKLPLVTVIPDRHGYHESKEKITDYIKESIGI